MTNPQWELMTERERVDSVLPMLWGWATALDRDAEFSELQLASIAYQCATRCAARWDAERGTPFDAYVQHHLAVHLAKARSGGTLAHPAERMLDAITEADAR